jgi:AcrR family transcriptional regulator
MVERIVAAGRAVLIERGFDGATTNRIAEAAGISPGSLYQYFPDKEAIISEVVDRYADQIAARVTAQMTTQIGTTDEATAIRQTIAVLLDAMDDQPELLRATFEHTPRLGVGDKIAALEQRGADIAIAHMRLRAQPAGHSATASWMLVRTVEHLTIRYLLDRPPIDRNEFLDELSALVFTYTQSPAVPK